jgi:hypothetical protein
MASNRMQGNGGPPIDAWETSRHQNGSKGSDLSMDFETIDDLVDVETIAKGAGIRNLAFPEKDIWTGKMEKANPDKRDKCLYEIIFCHSFQYPLEG